MNIVLIALNRSSIRLPYTFSRSILWAIFYGFFKSTI